jgi:PhzF family phenazine biosynthesis protein
LEGFFPKNYNSVVKQETKAGILPVSIEFSDDGSVNRVMMTQKKPILKDIHLDIYEIADSLKISVDKIDDSLPKQSVSTGLFTLPVCVESFETLKSIKPDFEKIKKICDKLDLGSFHLFTFQTLEPRSIYHARNFAPVYGINEDPVTGTANGAVCSYLLRNNIIHKNNLICEQGDIIGRPGRVFVDVNKNAVSVGGKAKIVKEKEIII